MTPMLLMVMNVTSIVELVILMVVWYCDIVVLLYCGIVELVIRGQWRVLPIHPLLYEPPKTLHTSFSRMSRVGTSAKLNKELIWVFINFTTMQWWGGIAWCGLAWFVHWKLWTVMEDRQLALSNWDRLVQWHVSLQSPLLHIAASEMLHGIA